MEANSHAVVLFENLVRRRCPGDKGRVWQIAEFIFANEFMHLGQLSKAEHPCEWLDADKLSSLELEFVNSLRKVGKVPVRQVLGSASLVVVCVGVCFCKAPDLLACCCIEKEIGRTSVDACDKRKSTQNCGCYGLLGKCFHFGFVCVGRFGANAGVERFGFQWKNC